MEEYKRTSKGQQDDLIRSFQKQLDQLRNHNQELSNNQSKVKMYSNFEVQILSDKINEQVKKLSLQAE